MSLLRSLVAVSSITICSRILGFTRDALIARLFGAGMATDAFFIAFKLPNFLRRIFAEGAFSQAFVPILAEYKTFQGEEATKKFISYIAGMLILILILASVAGILSAPWVIKITAPGFINPELFDLTSALLRVTFPYILLISLTSLVGAILNAWNIFSVPACAPILLNVSMISFMLFAIPFFHPPIMVLAWAVITGGLLQLIYQLPYLKKIGLLVIPRLTFRNPGVWRVLELIGPAILGVSISQVSLVINTILASFLETGSVSWMYYADRLMEFPSGVLGVALGTILLPLLSHSVVKSNNAEEYSCLLDWGLRICFLLALPSSVALVILAKPITVVLFQYDQFSAFDVMMTQRALQAYSVGLIGIMLVKVLAPGFYSRQDIKTPVQLAIISLIITQLMNIMFIGLLKHAGLSLSIGLGACINASLLYWQLRRQQLFQPQPGWSKFLLRLIFTVCVMAIAIMLLLLIMPDWTKGSMPNRLLRLIAVIVVGIICYVMTLRMLGLRTQYFMS
ncbi:murein biosynthesis integral membrane protein MurJ [Candidatus Palibaumannia cicadellinicola]|uniref:Probable lipid II flippase MurJ n=1 Tax=Baumannia cicadellinicola subsp. Homalodisca coagulata TaxID=374463 RepID=Q1LTI7_BAUCH|nr:murein biosynthesis integral membrane protein MurJ [Candidatus Baumannia cicadellinicola]ABF14329.1 integral membrane protein MviN [Baumannia cicadellinicola str. Hc (Homalodisca coagulata)]MBS0032719.1 murein biosynthesis integral membrane protein MurJ [Candidatus Baumannia cicadellinicola]MCJ7462289.1 murein biosynthesis integral membrane protein MurJ [Candidatus Baumannia cicadellinicola]MCJ7462809.1 murein biosynthesis integral membrane protein MurJ [Candidatus Baumannia cicadellinicola]